MGHANTVRVLGSGHHRVCKAPLKSQVTPPRPPVSTSHLLRGQTPGSGVRHQTSPVGLSCWVPEEPHEGCRSDPLPHRLDGDSEARWLRQSRAGTGACQTSAPRRAPLSGRGDLLGVPWAALGNAGAPCPVAAKQRVWPPCHSFLTKAGFSGAQRPTARPRWLCCLLWHPLLGKALAVPCGYILTRKLTRVREPGTAARPPWSRVAVVPTASRAWTRTSWGFWLPAPPRAPRVSRPLPAFRLAGCRHLLSFTGLFTGSALCAFLEEAFVFLL